MVIEGDFTEFDARPVRAGDPFAFKGVQVVDERWWKTKTRKYPKCGVFLRTWCVEASIPQEVAARPTEQLRPAGVKRQFRDNARSRVAKML